MPSLEHLREMVGGIDPVLNGPHVAALGRGARMPGMDPTVPPATPHVAQEAPNLDPTAVLS